VTSVGAIGAGLVLVVLGISGLGDQADLRTVYPAMHRVEAWVIRPFAVLALATGLIQALGSNWGLVKYWWVVIKLVITTLLTIVVFLLLEPTLHAAADIATGLSTGELDDAQRTRFVVFPALASVLFTVNAILGMYKPSWRLRSSQDDDARKVSTARRF
jgi:hypothetical protein